MGLSEMNIYTGQWEKKIDCGKRKFEQGTMVMDMLGTHIRGRKCSSRLAHVVQ